MKNDPNHAESAAPCAQRAGACCVRSNRTGTSLIEMLVVMSMSTVLFGTAIGTISLLLRAERNTSNGLWCESTVARLSRVLRIDVHAATDATLKPAAGQHGPRLELVASNHRSMTFEINGDSVTRVVHQSPQPEAREVFRLPASTDANFELAAATKRVKLMISIPSIHASSVVIARATRDVLQSGRRTIAVEADVARDYRFSQPAR